MRKNGKNALTCTLLVLCDYLKEMFLYSYRIFFVASK